MKNKMVAKDLFYELKIAELWQFKGYKVENGDKENGPSLFKPYLWQTGFSDVAKNVPFSAGTNGE